MIKRKPIRESGKVRLSNYFQKFANGDRVAVKKELGLISSFPKRLQGRSGFIENKRGSHYIVKIKDLNKEKIYIIHPIHLKKLKHLK